MSGAGEAPPPPGLDDLAALADQAAAVDGVPPGPDAPGAPGAPGAAPGAPAGAVPTDAETVQLCTQVWTLGCAILAPGYAITDDECTALGQATAPVLKKYLPDLGAVGVEFSLVLTLGAVFGPRLAAGMPARPEPISSSGEGAAGAGAAAPRGDSQSGHRWEDPPDGETSRDAPTGAPGGATEEPAAPT